FLIVLYRISFSFSLSLFCCIYLSLSHFFHSLLRWDFLLLAPCVSGMFIHLLTLLLLEPRASCPASRIENFIYINVGGFQCYLLLPSKGIVIASILSSKCEHHNRPGDWNKCFLP